MATEKHYYHAIPDNEDHSSNDIEHILPVVTSWSTPQRRRIYKILSTLAVLAIVSHIIWDFAASYCRGTGYQRQPLRFTPEGTFQISVFEDLHFGENAWDVWGPKQDIKTLRVMSNVLSMEKPNLVVLNGDLITGENTFRHNSSSYLDMLVQPIIQRKLPFASTYGNHDSAYDLSREEIFAREGKYKESWTGRMVDDESGAGVGVTNYYLEVWPYESESKSKKKGRKTAAPSLILWFFDSRGGHFYQQSTTTSTSPTSSSSSWVPQQNWVSPTVVSWFLSTHASLMQKYNGKVIPSLAFVHIPTNASAAFQTEVGVDRNLQPGINDDYVLAMQAEGWCADDESFPDAETKQEEKAGEGKGKEREKEREEECRYGGQDVPFMRAIANAKGLKVVVTGHDHGNSWCFKWNSTLPGVDIEPKNGVVWCFGQRTGYGGYGRWARGSRQIIIKVVGEREDGDRRGEGGEEGVEIETWIRLESGRVVGAVKLNETFGRDRYPATEDRGSPQCSGCGVG